MSIEFDINAIGIGSMVSAIIVVTVNIWLHQKNISLDRANKQLEKLYNPLNTLISKEKKYLDFLKSNKDNFEQFAVEYYQFFLDIRDIYFTNEVYGSLNLKIAFNTLEHNYQSEFSLYSKFKNLKNKKEIYKEIALFELKHKLDTNGLSEMEQKIEKVIDVIQEDMFLIYHHKPVKRYYQ